LRSARQQRSSEACDCAACILATVRQQAGRPQRAGGPAFDLVVSKLRRPLMRPGTVRRSLLVERLARGESRPIVSVVAPPGYGKTTLLSQWAERNGQSFAWVSVEEPDPCGHTCRLPTGAWPAFAG
jgi:hypothetical protein